MVDAGGGSGMQSRWMSEGWGETRHLSRIIPFCRWGYESQSRRHSECRLIQCSIDAPPIKDGAVTGIVICHNVIQHTPSVEVTARALWRLLAPHGVVSVQLLYEARRQHDMDGPVSMVSSYSAVPVGGALFCFRLGYSRAMALLRFVPVFGWFLEKSLFMVRGGCGRWPESAHEGI